jgi:signal transduction histidine kinase
MVATPERLKVAQELHDGIAQDLVGLGYSLDLLLSDSDLSTTSRSQLRTTRFQVDNLISKVREEIFLLRRQSSIPFHEALSGLVQEMSTQFEVKMEVQEVLMSPDQSTQMTAITKEILRNIELHSGATHIEITLYPINNRSYLEIFDNGIGGATLKDGHWGLVGIKEKVLSLQGTIEIDGAEGTRITILL